MEAVVLRPQRNRDGGWAFLSRDAVNPGNVLAGVLATMLYVFGPVPLYLAAAAQFAGDDTRLLAGFFTAFMTAGLVTAALSLAYRQPLAFGWSGPGLVYMAAAAPHYTLAEIAGAGVVAGLLMLVLAAPGITEHLVRAVPLPVVMGVFAGSALHYVTDGVAAVSAEPLVVGLPVAGYFTARAIGRIWLPPLGIALLIGLPVLVISGGLTPVALEPHVPSLVPVVPSFDLRAITALALPLTLLSVAAGNLQAFGVLRANGYEPPYRAVNATTGMVSVLYALMGAPPAAMQRLALAPIAGPDGGPPQYRYLGAVFASIGALAIACLALPLSEFVAGLSAEFVTGVLALVLLATVVDATRAAAGQEAGFAGIVALLVAASSIDGIGLGSTTWALAGGVAVFHLEARPGALLRLGGRAGKDGEPLSAS